MRFFVREKETFLTKEENMQNWKQPQGIWVRRGASQVLCEITQGRYTKTTQDKDDLGNHLWHYWAHGKKPEQLLSTLHLFPTQLRNQANLAGETALWRLVLLGKLNLVQYWHTHWPEDFKLPIHTQLLIPAAWSGHLELFRFILALSEESLDCQDKNGMSPLMIAIHRQPMSGWVLLLENGATPHILDHKHRNALHHLAEYGDLEGFQILEASGGDLEQRDVDNKTPEMIFERAQHKPKGIEKALRKRWLQKYRQLCLF